MIAYHKTDLQSIPMGVIPHTESVYQWRRLIKGLAKHGARFVEIRPGTRAPSRKGWNQTANTLSANDALSLIGKGYNIGLAAGTGNLYVFDFDNDAERGHECAQLSGGAYTYRPNATNRAKFIFRCEERLPTRHAVDDMDLIGFNANDTHSQATIAGTHNSGAPILWGGTTIPTLSKETVAALWQEWTGEELFRERTYNAPRGTQTAQEHDIALALGYLPGRMSYEAWCSILMAVHSALPNERGIALCEAWSPGYAGEIAEKFASFQGSGVTIGTLFHLAKQHGYEPPKYEPPPDEDVRAYLRDLKEWVTSSDCNALLKEKGIKRVGAAIAVLLPIVDLAIERGTKRVAGSIRELSSQWGMNRSTVMRTLDKLKEVGLMRTEVSENGVVVDLSFLEVDLDEPVYTNITGRGGSSRSSSDEASFELRHLGDDAFSSYPYAYAQRRRAKAQGDTVLMASLGSTGWLLWKYLEDGGTVSEIAEASGLTVATVRACIKKYDACGLLEVESIGRQKSYVLKKEAEARLDIIRPHMVTAGVGQMRLGRNHADTADYAALKLRRRKDMEPRDVLWWESLRNDKDAAACLIFDTLEENGFDARMKVGKERRVRTRSRYDHGEEWRTWGKALYDEWHELGDISEDDKLRLLTLARTTDAVDAKTFREIHADMREKVRVMMMLSRRAGRYALPQGEDYYEPPQPAPTYQQLMFEMMEVIPHG